jgi:hypothetical protein
MLLLLVPILTINSTVASVMRITMVITITKAVTSIPQVLTGAMLA